MRNKLPLIVVADISLSL